ncbi:hypothetical protein Vretimale_3319 [Volvox reticuliferus]|uniref:Uncharacterized protein n=1 Tax=Volvox reticuliferus TaxID=1737510 RepID=A0A8J4FC29_9CHLO|nr:hypothetical protein Vretifemale_883 [Volvox reticuliferus]GIL97759.1 hypothetical protein Vretimale_3319 [Volvox reticuliferus]
MKGSAYAVFVLAIVAAHSCARKTLAGDTGSSVTGNVLKQGVGSLVSEWYLSLKTSKGYCGLVTATQAAGGYGFAIVCNNKYPQYGSTFAVLLPDNNGGGGDVSGIDTVAAAAQGEAAARVRASTGGSLSDASAPLIVSTGREVRVLARSAGLCNTPPVPSPGGMDRVQPSVSVMGGLAAMAQVIHSWMYSWRCAIPGAWKYAKEHVAESCDDEGSSGDSIDGGGCSDNSHRSGDIGCTKEADGFTSRRWWLKGCKQGQMGLTQDLPPRPVICALGQPSGMSYKIFKANLKDGESVDLDKEWIYLMEGDKYCTLADVAGLNAVVSCHLDAPGWSGYKFQIQRLSYPRSQLHSLLTGSPCGVRLPGLPGLHDMECQGGQQAGRAPEVDLVLQTPGSPLAAGVVVGLSTFSPGLMGAELQRCCAHPASPHIILCEPPPPGPVANECWFQMYDVKIASSPLTEDSAGMAAKIMDTGKAGDDSEHAAVGLAPTTDNTDPWVEAAPEQVGTGFGSFLPSFLRALQLEMSPVGLDPDLESESEFAAVISRADIDGTRVRHRSLLSWLWLERGMRKVGEEDGNVEAEDEGEEGVSERYRRSLLSGEGDWNPDGRPDPQPSMLLEGRDGGSDDPSVSGVEMVEVVDIATKENATLAQVTRASALADGKDDRLRSGQVTAERTANAMAVEPAPLTGLWPARKQWELLRGLWPTRFGRVSCGRGVSDAAVGTAAPLGDRSLVMLMNRAFGRYCSVSLDGTLLCISAQASNASRNLFTLFMPSIPVAVAETIAETVAGAAVTTVGEQG